MVTELESTIEAPITRVWARIVTAEGVNYEMAPWMTMRFPRGKASLTIDNFPVGQPIGRAWLRLFGVVPFDYDLLTIAELDPGRRFLEQSTMLSMRRWEHERTLTPFGDGRTTVRDRVTFQTRLPMLLIAPLIARVVRAFFEHRHRRLHKHFG